MAELVSLDEIGAAARRLHGVAVRTPLIPFTGKAKAASTLLIKPESLQPTGAFKLRGAYNAVYAVTRDLDSCILPAGVVAHSSGNHGFAVAYAARLLGISAAIVVPENAPAVKTDAIESTGAELVRVKPTLATRIAATDEIARVRRYHPVAPFDDRDVIAGQGTVGLEIAEDFTAAPGQGAKQPAAVLVPVSGGGLISGIAIRPSWPTSFRRSPTLGSAMKSRTWTSILAYTSARILMFGCAVILLYVAGARGILLLALGLVISALASYVLLNRQRALIAERLNGRLSKAGSKVTEFRGRLEEGSKSEDEEDEETEQSVR